MEKKGDRAHAEVLNDPSFPALKHYIIQATGLSYYEEREDDLAAGILRTLGEAPWTSASEFLTRISVASAETMDRLTEELTIGETFFFRHTEMFDALREHVFPEIHQRRSRERVLRIWSAACSIGAEPYSLSILLRQDLAHLFNGWDIEIFGTDINRRFLTIAQKAEYENWALRGLPEEQRRRCFVQRDKKWVLQPRFAKGVTFFHHNLVRDRFPSLVNRLFAIDLIVCRNVMIYFSHETVRQLAEQFHQTLVPGGWLAVGHAEPHTEIFRAFRTVNTPGAILYQRHTVSSEAEHDETPRALTREKPVFREPLATPLVERPVPRPPLSLPIDIPLPSRETREPQPAKSQPHCIDFDSVKQLADSGEFARARACCEQLLIGDQLNPALHFLHALLLEHSGSDDDARSAFRRVLYLDKDLALAHYHLGVIEERRGNRAQALRSWRNAQAAIEGLSDEVAIPLGDGLTAADLRRLLEMHVVRRDAGSQR